MNRGYVCPPDAGPAWRAACDYGFDMSLVQDALFVAQEAVGRERDLATVELLHAIKERKKAS